MPQQENTMDTPGDSVAKQPSSSANSFWWRQHLAACIVLQYAIRRVQKGNHKSQPSQKRKERTRRH
ncbi:Protein of unknown function [Gryllus bimaculatus]|nr:Protein of unknown function [Gryllus bimaculatus]